MKIWVELKSNFYLIKEAVNILENAKSIEDKNISAQILDLEAKWVWSIKRDKKDSLKNLEFEDKKFREKNYFKYTFKWKNIRSVDVRI